MSKGVVAVAAGAVGVRLLGAFDRTDPHGYDAIEVRNNRADVRKAASPAFAVNLSPEASDPALVGKVSIAKMLPAATAFTFVDASAEAQELHGNLGNEREVWPVLSWVLFALIGAEFLLSTRNMAAARARRGRRWRSRRYRWLPARGWEG